MLTYYIIEVFRFEDGGYYTTSLNKAGERMRFFNSTQKNMDLATVVEKIKSFIAQNLTRITGLPLEPIRRSEETTPVLQPVSIFTGLARGLGAAFINGLKRESTTT